MLCPAAAFLKCFAPFSVDYGLNYSSVFPMILALNLTACVYMAPKGDGLSSPCILGHLSAIVTTGQSLLLAGHPVAVFGHVFQHPLEHMCGLYLQSHQRVGVRVAGTALLDGRD